MQKGWGGYSEPNAFLDEMVVNGLLTRKPGPFGDVVYRPTKKGNEYIDLKNELIGMNYEAVRQ